MEQHREMESHRCALSQTRAAAEVGCNFTREPPPIEPMQGERIDKQKQRKARKAAPPPRETSRPLIPRQVPNSRMALPSFTLPSGLTCVAIPPATTSANRNRANFCHRQRSRNHRALGSRLTICLFGAQRAPNYAVIVKDRRIKLASSALGTARVDLATCGPVLARWLEALLGVLARPHL